MDKKNILAITDHTLLRPTSTWAEIKEILDDAMKFNCASACIPASYVQEASDYVEGRLPICTVIGFPHGYDTSSAKMFMAEDALENGAAEIDMVINLGWVKDSLYPLVEDEIMNIRDITADHILKVIVEASELTEKELIRMCEIVNDSGADFIKTSTGFASGGATFEVVKTMHDHIDDDVGIKASGGISSFAEAEKFIELGASRLGSSRLVKIAKADENS